MLFETSAEDAAKRISDFGATAVIKLGAKGALIARGDQKFKVNPIKTDAIDTTAAGDMFAAGFLFGFLKEKSLSDCGKIATILASDVVSRFGAHVSDNAIKKALEI